MQEKEKEPRGSYVHRVREETHRFANDLMAENEKLRTRVAGAESDKVRAQEQLLALQEEIERDRREHVQLQQRLVEIEVENQSFSERFLEVEQNNSNLANLYVVSYRLHGTLERSEVLLVIEEIIINLIGSEELAVFEVNEDGSSLDLVSSFGIEPERYRHIPMGSGLIGQVAVEGRPYIAERRAHEELPENDHLIACIPLKLADRVTGAVAMFSLLPQKSGLGSLDYELFDLLATHAAMALYCSGIQERLKVAANMNERMKLQVEVV
jgi:hypothetical protein